MSEPFVGVWKEVSIDDSFGVPRLMGKLKLSILKRLRSCMDPPPSILETPFFISLMRFDITMPFQCSV